MFPTETCRSDDGLEEGTQPEWLARLRHSQRQPASLSGRIPPSVHPDWWVLVSGSSSEHKMQWIGRVAFNVSDRWIRTSTPPHNQEE